MTLTIREIETIKDALKVVQMEKHPGLRDYNDYSVLNTVNESMATQVQYVEERAKEDIESKSIWAATGEYLDLLVTDRNITRQEGNRATGQVIFRCSRPADNSIVIPSGTILSAIGSDNNKVLFETTADCVIDVGFLSGIVDAQAQETGTDGNVPEYSINTIRDHISGISRVENVSPFSGGTEEESDDDLRERYKYATDINGKATRPLIEQHVFDLDTVRECHIYQAARGEIEAVVDSSTLTTVDDDVVNCLLENIAIGIVSRGKLLASIENGVIIPNISIIEAGKLYVRVESSLVSVNEQFTLQYITKSGLSKTATVNIPSGAVSGDVIVATLHDPTDFVVQVDSGIYTGAKSYSILGGLGTYPYLYILPRKVIANARISIVQTEDPDPQLKVKIEDSITAFLDSFKIGDDIEYSDLIQFIYRNFMNSNEVFTGIDQISSVVITANGLSINGFGQVITIESDQRVDPGSVTVTLI
jgi:hypothetical protein